MKQLLLRRIEQLRQLGFGSSVRIIAERARRHLRVGVERFGAFFFVTGLATWTKESAPKRIVTASRNEQDRGLSRLADGFFSYFGTSSQCIQQNAIQSNEIPRPWNRVLRQMDLLYLPNLTRIDFQLDPTSRFHWSAKSWSKGISYGNQLGVEVKWPWELGRLQHLPAIAARISDPTSDHGLKSAGVIQNHIVDFVRSNPPGFGVQWLCPMDVGIRIANLLVAVDLARAAGVEFEHKFLQLVSATARDHGRHITRNLEWGDRLCSNHYLANVAGLLFAGSYLGDDSEGEDWVAFAGRVLILQTRKHFHADGSNFAASTCYHRLSAEMVVYSVALMMWISRERPELAKRWWGGRVPNYHPSPAAPPTTCVQSSRGFSHPFDADVVCRISGMGSFTRSLLRADGSVPQIGDNDSGRFMRLQQTDDPAADLLDHTHLCHAVDALLGRPLPEFASEAHWLSKWLGNALLDDPGEKSTEQAVAWREFGLCVWRYGGLHVTLRAGHVGQGGNGGHAHCDQLSITLAIDGVPVIDDPGTGVYTPNPDLRNRLRSSGVHSTVQHPSSEQGSWLPGRWGLFAMKDLAMASLVSFGDRCGVVRMKLGGVDCYREVELVSGAELVVRDSGPVGLEARFTLVPSAILESITQDQVIVKVGMRTVEVSGQALRVEDVPWSDRYGIVRTTKSIVGKAADSRIRVRPV